MKYKGFLLDEFQEKAIKYLEKDESVVVSAPTGSGKTLIADYLINKYVGSSYRVIYTAPIKALSNQKYIEFSNAYGKENIGLVTGDTVINPLAQIVIMTTEIYRNMLLAKDPSILDIKFVIFDEIHYMSDIERGTVWEESIIFSPSHIRFLCLSATIPNKEIFSRWIQDIKKHKVRVVSHNKRAVPLTFSLFDNDIKELDKNLINKKIAKKSAVSKKKRKLLRKEQPIDVYKKPLALVKSLSNKKLVPAIFFMFSRKQVEDYADNIAKRVNLLSTAEQEEIKILIKNHGFDEKAKEYQIKKYNTVKKYLMKGIGIHHAGLFPMIKELVELLFSKGLVKVLFATETFAVGINMPAKTVVFASLRKYDGISFRSLHSQEFYQMAGRAGRRGIDQEGNVIVIYDDSTDMFALKRLMKIKSEPVISQFKLSYNTILNLIKNHNDDEIEIILKSNFDYYVRKSEQNIRIMSSYNAKLKNLIELGFVSYADQVQSDKFYVVQEGCSYALTPKGRFASKIYAHELSITELFFTGFYKKFTLPQINMLISAIVYEPRKSDSFSISKKNKYVYEEALIKLRDDEFLYNKINKKALYRLFSMVYLWSNKAEFSEIMTYTNQQEGDVIRHFKQIIDFLRQIRRATEDFELASVIDQARLLIDRDIINMTL